MKLLIGLTALVSVLLASAPAASGATVRAEEFCGEESCKRNSDCTYGSICAYCKGPNVIAGGSGLCKPAGAPE
jgi:hypothetical protein